MNQEQLNKLKEDVGTSVIATEMDLHFLEKLKYYPQLYKGEVKKYGNLFQKQLLKYEKNHFDKADEEAEESTDIMTQQYLDCVKYICQGNLVNLTTSIMLNEAYRLDPDSITGIAKKILKNSKK